MADTVPSIVDMTEDMTAISIVLRRASSSFGVLSEVNIDNYESKLIPSVKVKLELPEKEYTMTSTIGAYKNAATTNKNIELNAFFIIACSYFGCLDLTPC